MSMLLQVSNERYAVIELSSTKSSPERVVVAYPNEETLRGPLADSSIVGVGFSSRDEAVSAAGAAMTKAAAPRQADGLAAFHVEVTQVDPLREQLTDRMRFFQFADLLPVLFSWVSLPQSSSSIRKTSCPPHCGQCLRVPCSHNVLRASQISQGTEGGY